MKLAKLQRRWSAVALLAGMLSAPVAIAADSSASIDSFGASKDGAEFLGGLLDTVRKWGDYTCESELWNYKPDKMTKSGCKFFYKDNQVRVQVMGGGYRDGSIIVRTKEGVVKAKGGGVMGFMVMNLDPESRMLILPSGVNVMRTDLPDVFADMQHQISSGYKSKVTATPVVVQDIPEKVYVLDEFEPGGQQMRRVFWGADAKPVRIDHFKAGKRVTSAWFKNLSIDQGISNDLFRL